MTPETLITTPTELTDMTQETLSASPTTPADMTQEAHSASPTTPADMTQETLITPQALQLAADAAGRQIPPLWPLASSVAVNPFLGQTQSTLANTAARLARVGGVNVTMPRDWYRERIRSGEIGQQDLQAALAGCPENAKPANLEQLQQTLDHDAPTPHAMAGGAVPTVADLAAQCSGVDWPAIIADRTGAWASGYFDAGQSLWAAPTGPCAWRAYCEFAKHDLTPELLGLKGFCTHVDKSANTAQTAIAHAVGILGLDAPALDTYFHQLLFGLQGWAQYARFRQWQAELADGSDHTLTDLLAIRLLWEVALFTRYAPEIADAWIQSQNEHAKPVTARESDIVDVILQEAAERAAQRRLAETLHAFRETTDNAPVNVQAVFCIDVRSEVFRRALEAVSPSIQTRGFAGFFGLFSSHQRFASDVREHRLPVLLNPAVSSRAAGNNDTDSIDSGDMQARYAARAKRAWGRFKLAAVSSLAFVEAMGPVYVGRLIRDSLAVPRPTQPREPAPRFEPALDRNTRINTAESVLRAMSLTDDFARIVLIAGHGANVVNNPHASGLHCGACGGYAGDVNARLLASLLNDKLVHAGLAERGIHIPDSTLFIAALHDTTTDTITLFDGDTDCSHHAADVTQLQQWLSDAGSVTREERARHLPRAGNEHDIARRALDWAEVRPEWALAGCQAFIAAPRHRTSGRQLEGRAFLHDYESHKDRDNGFAVLELIMTAPVVVASWISLQYYGSTVAPRTFGSGDKLLHNVVGGCGVLEGNGGAMRGGLPWQSVHDGEHFRHEPLRLTVCIEAPLDAMTDILKRHESVRALFDNRWLHLMALDDKGQLAHRYAGNLQWQKTDLGEDC